MRIHLDTIFLVDAMRDGRAAQALEQWIASAEEIEISALAWCEFLSGPLRGAQQLNARAIVGAAVPLGETEAALAADLYNRSGRGRGALADCQIAATAILRNAALATLDRGFGRFVADGLMLARL